MGAKVGQSYRIVHLDETEYPDNVFVLELDME